MRKKVLAYLSVVVLLVGCNGGSGSYERNYAVPSTTTVEKETLAEEKRDDAMKSEAKMIHSEKKPIKGSTKEFGVATTDTLEEIKKVESDKTKPKVEMLTKSDHAVSIKKSKKLTVSGLKAGFQDDNKQYNHFLGFLEKFKQTKHIPFDITNRYVFKLKDKKGLPVANADVLVESGQTLLKKAKTYSDGTFLLFPSEFGTNKFNVTFSNAAKSASVFVTADSKKRHEVVLDTVHKVQTPLNVDIVFVMDTTGSMGEEIERLKRTVELIYLNISNMKTKVTPRFGMVLYKDRNERYVTKTIALTSDLSLFEKQLSKVRASGGGDAPEDLQSALKDLLKSMKWNEDAIKLSFVITDAAPHLDYNQKYTYIDAMQDASREGIKLFSIGTGGLNINGEYVLRQLSQYTFGRYVFLTYGEKGESKGGSAGSVSHHTGANYQTDKLESIVIKFVKEEIGNVLGKVIEEEEYFEATKIDEEKKEQTLEKLFFKALTQLIDYSSEKLQVGVALSILPMQIPQKEASLKTNAEYFSEQLLLLIKQANRFKLIERKDMQKVVDEMKLQMSGIINEENAVEMGKLAGAHYLLFPTLYKKENKYEIYLKLIKVKTGEVLSVTKMYMDQKLGI